MGDIVYSGCMRNMLRIAHAVKFVFCASSTTMPSGQWFTGLLCYGMIFPYRAEMTMVHGNPWTPKIWQIHFRFYYAVAQTPFPGFEDKTFLERQVKRMSTRNKRPEGLAETGGRISVQGYRCTENAQYWKNCTTSGQ